MQDIDNLLKNSITSLLFGHTWLFCRVVSQFLSPMCTLLGGNDSNLKLRVLFDDVYCFVTMDMKLMVFPDADWAVKQSKTMDIGGIYRRQ